MSKQVQMKAQARMDIGSGESRRLRREGWVPGILYGPDLAEPLPLQVDVQELRRVLPGGQRGVIQLAVEREGDTKSYPVMIKEIQRNRLKGDITHLDLYQVSLTRKVTTSVPVHLVGTAPGVKEGGVLQHQLWEVEIECLPGQLPDNLEADISQLEVGSVLTVKDLQVPEGIEVLTPPDDAVVSVLAPAMEEEEVEEGAAEEEGAEAAEVPAGEEEREGE